MKNIFYLGSLLLLMSCFNLMAQEAGTQIKIKIVDEQGNTIEKIYDSQEALEQDPELEELGIEVESQGGKLQLRSENGRHQSVMIQQQSGSNNSIVIQQGGGQGATQMREERLRSMQERDSLLSRHQELRAERMEEARERRAEMRRRMEERRATHRRDRQLIIINELNEEEATRLGMKKQRLQLENLQILPDPDAESLELSFRARSDEPVRIQLFDVQSRLLLDESREPVGHLFKGFFQLEEFREGTYFLQISQKGKDIGRKIQIR